MSKERLTFEFIVDEEVFKDSGPHNEFDAILLKPLRDAGYKVEQISNVWAKDHTFVFEISKSFVREPK